MLEKAFLLPKVPSSDFSTSEKNNIYKYQIDLKLFACNLGVNLSFWPKYEKKVSSKELQAIMD